MAVRSIARRRLWASSASSSESPVAFRSCFFNNRLTLSEDVDPDDDAEEADPEMDDTPTCQLNLNLQVTYRQPYHPILPLLRPSCPQSWP